MVDVRTRAIMQPMIAWAKPKGSCGTRMPASPFSTRMPANIEPSRRAAGNGPMLARQRTEPKERLERPSERIRAVWIRTWTAAPSGPRKIQFRAFDNPADPWKNIVDGKVVHFGGHAARRIFD